MGSCLHTISAKAFPERKRPTKRQQEWLLNKVMRAFDNYFVATTNTYKSIARSYYMTRGVMPEEVEWSIDAQDYDSERIIHFVVSVYSHSLNSIFDHWLELFVTYLAQRPNVTKPDFTEKQFEILPNNLSYSNLLTQTVNEQYIVLERGLYMLHKADQSILPLQPSAGQPKHHFCPESFSDNHPISIDFFKPSEQARILAHLQSDYCLCPICQGERSTLGLI